MVYFNNMYKKKASLLILVFVVASCNYTEKAMVDGLPLLKKIAESKEMDEDTKRGLFDGCFSAYNARGNSFYSTQMYFRHNPKMATNEKYTFAWGRGYTACFPEANLWTFFPIGTKATAIEKPGAWVSPVGQSATMPLGNDAESKPAVWYFDESINNGLPGASNYGTNNNFFGVFGSCYLC